MPFRPSRTTGQDCPAHANIFEAMRIIQPTTKLEYTTNQAMYLLFALEIHYSQSAELCQFPISSIHRAAGRQLEPAALKKKCQLRHRGQQMPTFHFSTWTATLCTAGGGKSIDAMLVKEPCACVCVCAGARVCEVRLSMRLHVTQKPQACLSHSRALTGARVSESRGFTSY